MDDKAILDLYWARSERAIAETDSKYGAYCYSIASNILSSREDSEECVSDTYLAAWNSIPPKRPAMLSAFLGKMTRYISLNRWKQRSRLKRGGGEVPLCLDELEGCVSGRESAEDTVLRKEALTALNRFLEELPELERKVFLCRYWYFDAVKDIGPRFGLTPAQAASILHRTRQKLNKHLAKEGLL